MKITIQTIPHKKQRYDTIGDYINPKHGDLKIFISEMGDQRYEILVAIHELIEFTLATREGIKLKEIDRFDIAFEKLREQNPKLIGDMEPGDMPSAPYHREHQFATEIEKLLAIKLGVDWKLYGDKINSL